MADAADPRTRIVLITHGIFSQGPWFDALAKAFHERGLEARGLRYSTVYLLQFWIPEFIGRWLLPWFSRESALQRLLQQILAYPRDEYHVSIVAHSFGTWLVANILRRYPAVKLQRAVFLGCIVKEEFPWQDVIGRNIQRDCILNDAGTKDVLPLLANAATWGYGPTGTFGFGQPHIRDRFHNVGHSDLLRYEFARDFIAPFLTDGTINQPRDNRRQFRRTAFLDFFKYVKWLILVALVVALVIWGRSIPRPIPESANKAPAALYPDLKSWDKLIDPIKPGDSADRKFQVRLDKWKSYLAKGAQPWIFAPPRLSPLGQQLPVEPQGSDVALGWFEMDVSKYDLQTFSYICETDNGDIAIKEVYAFLVHNDDPEGFAPVYRQMKPTVEKTVKDVELREFKGGEQLLCFVLVGPTGTDSVPSNPKAWGLRLRRK